MRHIEQLVITALLLAGLAACSADPSEMAKPKPPHGYLAALRLSAGDRQVHFGPFVGYYFRPLDPADLDRLQFVCLNERQFYTRDLPEGALLYEGEAVRADLPPAPAAPPTGQGRIQPLFWDAVPAPWRATRPEPVEEFVHFHSCYDAAGPVLSGYWLRHVAKAAFTYDMGGRVGPGSVLYHPVVPGPDRDFAALVEFDAGPSRGPSE